MLDETKLIPVQWNGYNKQHYIEKGYVFSKSHDVFWVNPKDLQKDSKYKVHLICDNCGKPYMATNLTYNSTEDDFCPECYKKRFDIWKIRERKQIVDKICEEKNYVLKSPYDVLSKSENYIDYECPIHGDQRTQVYRFISGHCCKRCAALEGSKKSVANTLIKRRQTLYKKCTDKANALGFKFLTKEEEINRNTDRIRYICPRHGEKTSTIYNFLSHPCVCFECGKESNSKRFRRSAEDVVNIIHSLGAEIRNPEDYVNGSLKNLYITCPFCKQFFLTDFQGYIQHGGKACDECNDRLSVGEQRIKDYLEKNNVEYCFQYTFEDCRDTNKLPFDFYLPSINLIIEFDGRQHFVETDFFSYSYEKTVYHDNIKNEYCKNHGIEMLRIPYWYLENGTIEQFLDKHLFSHKEIV